MSSTEAAKIFREKADTYLEMTRCVRDEQKRQVLHELFEENEAKAELLERMILTQEGLSNFHAVRPIPAVEDDLEIIVKPANWQTAGKPARWNWQVRQRHSPKYLTKGVTMGSKERAQAAGEAAKARILEKAAG